MAQVTDSNSAPTLLSPADINAETGATASPAESAQQECADVEHCIQDLDPSRFATTSGVEGCNLECSYCALRWSARRALDRLDS